ncbi:alpha-amylase 1 [Folsomia candida]|uniref:alpha-amylase 1 n=1 Tax=Folsomia candida TaxID=158441 RepID=UPI000B8FE9DB|nr:alpha-amylase 1 [Folsomia candida]
MESFRITRVLVALSVYLLSLAHGQYNMPSFATNRTTMVHLFEWKWTDIAAECERFLGPAGYAGVQVSPVNENAVILDPYRPWWERYQPVSYLLQTRSGTEAQFGDMVRRCNNVGVRIIVDCVINHMTHRTTAGLGTAGSSFNSANKQYPTVPYGPQDFHNAEHCPTASGDIENHQDPVESRNCELGGLRDLNQGISSVREKITAFMNYLIDFGVAGFRIDAAKQIWPQDMQSIADGLKDLAWQHGFPPGSRPFIFQEIIILGEEPMAGSDYFGSGRATEFKYGLYLGEALFGRRQLKDLANIGEPAGMYPSDYAMSFVDNHDNQRGHGAGGTNIVSHLQPKLYKIANAFMLAWPYGQAKVMSSYVWSGDDADSWVGPPNTDGATDDVVITPEETCTNGWVCEHRWRQIKTMVAFRNLVGNAPVQNWWDNGNNQISFCRGNLGFIALNNEGSDLDRDLQTCLPAGDYCDITTAEIVNGACTGRKITVGGDGLARVFISGGDEELVFATHVNAKV